MAPRTLVLALLLAWPLPASAGGVFDTGLGIWTPSGFWHRQPAPGCVAPHSGVACVYYGVDGACTYGDNGQEEDACLTSASIALTSPQPQSLTFWMLYQVQSYDPECHDQLYVEIYDTGASKPQWNQLAELSTLVDPPGGSLGVGYASGGGLGGPALWQYESIQLGEFQGHTVALRFHFVSSGLQVGNQLCGPADGLDGFLGYGLDEVQVGPTPLLKVSKSASPAVVAPGNTVTFSLAVENDGPSAAAFSVWDTLPAGSLFAGASNGGTLSGGLVQWSLPSVPSGAPANVATVQLMVQAPASLAVPANWVNTAGGLSSLSTTPQFSSQVLAKVRAPGLAFAKSVNAPQMANGDIATYTISLENDTPLTQSGLTLVDSVPSAFSVTGSYPPINGNTFWTLAPLQPGGVLSFSLWGPVYGQDGQLVVNSAQLNQGSAGLAQATASLVVHKPVQPGITLDAIYPNPAPSRAAGLPQGAFVVYTLNTPMAVTLDVFDVAGDKVRSLAAPGAQGQNQVAWDLANEQGRRVASGVYLLRLWSSLAVQPQPKASGFVAVLR